MDTRSSLALLDPTILFFFLGIFAGAVRSNLAVPEQVTKFLSLYLLMSMGFKGGVSMAASGFTPALGVAVAAAMILATLIPAYTFALLRRRVNAFDAAAIAATYGSVSAVTFITAGAFLERQGIAAGGHMTVAMILMESPAIIMAVFLANLARQAASAPAVPVPALVGAGASHAGEPAPTADQRPMSMRAVLHEAFTDGAHLLLLGSLLIGFLTGEPGKKVLDPFTGQIQKGLLAFFLLDMGLIVALRLRDLKADSAVLAPFALLAPLVNAALAIVLARLFGMPLGDAFLLTVLAASASYIVVPAVVRHAIPEANASLYFGMALAMTFPFNIMIGIPLYFGVVQALWR